MQVHKEAEGHLVGFPHSLHLQTIRNLPTGFTLHVIYHIMKSSLQAQGEMLKSLWRWFVIACFSLEFSGCPVTWWAVLTSFTCQPESDFSNAMVEVCDRAMHLQISTQIPERPSLHEMQGTDWFRLWILCFWPSENSDPAVRWGKRSCD